MSESHCRQESSTLQLAAAATTLVSGATVLSAAADAQGTRCYQLKRLVHSQKEAKNTKKHANKTRALMSEWGTSSFCNYCSVKLYEASKGMGAYKLSSELPSRLVHGLVPATTLTKHTDTLEARITNTTSSSTSSSSTALQLLHVELCSSSSVTSNSI